MFYPILIEYLTEDPALVAAVTEFEGGPAIFSDEAPEDAKKPYAVVRIDSGTLPDRVVATSNVYIDYWDEGVSRTAADQWARDLEDRLDTIKLRSTNAEDIRFSLSSQGYILDKDPRVIHHNSTFGTRQARSRWMRDTLT